VQAVQSGPLVANAVPATVTQPNGRVVPFNPLQPITFDALGHAYALAKILSGGAAVLAALLALIGTRPVADDALKVSRNGRIG
jgi:hypothetical protein